jgi:branched-chain amino acid transport system permease protein
MGSAQRSILLAVALGAVALAAPLIAPNDYVVGVLARICLQCATLALGLNIVVGFAGLLDIGYVAFFGIGSYLYAFLASPQFGVHLPFLLALPIVVVATALFGILIGAPTLRLGGDYLAIVTLGFGEITYILLLNLGRLVKTTNGTPVIYHIVYPALLGHVMSKATSVYYLFLAVLVAALLASRRLQHSRIGWAWQAIREDELAARGWASTPPSQSFRPSR